MKPVAGLPSCPRGRLAEEVCREIADGIVLGRFAPNARLDETMLAAMFGVSRTPVREALKQLAATGLATCRPNRGTVVAGLSSDPVKPSSAARTRFGRIVHGHRSAQCPSTAGPDRTRCPADPSGG